MDRLTLRGIPPQRKVGPLEIGGEIFGEVAGFVAIPALITFIHLIQQDVIGPYELLYYGSVAFVASKLGKIAGRAAGQLADISARLAIDFMRDQGWI